VSRLVLAKVYPAALFGIVLGAAVVTSAATITTSKTKRHSAGTTRVASKVTTHTSSHTGVKSAKTGVSTHAAATGTVAQGRRHGARPTLAVRRTRYHEHFSASSFADNLTLGDVTEGEDPVVRAAAIEALGNMNGTAIAMTPRRDGFSRW
jgi:hypothetical protein